MISFQSGNATITVHFKPLIICGIVIGAILLVQVIRAIVLSFKFRKMTTSVIAGNYDRAIRIGEPLLKIYQKYHRRLPTKALASSLENLNLTLAIAYFARSNEEMFFKRIQELKQFTDLKEFWLALSDLQKNDFDAFRKHANNISCAESVAVNRDFLEAYFAYKQQQFEQAREKMAAVSEKLTISLLKQFANEVLQSQG